MFQRSACRVLLRPMALSALIGWSVLSAPLVGAQTSPPAEAAAPAPSAALDAAGYRKDAAQHLYARYAPQIWRGKLPPLLHAVLITDTEVDASGQVQGVTVVRAPASAGEVTPRVVDMIRKASPFPSPAAMGKATVYREIWLIDKSGRFQVDTLSEGQL